MPSNSAASPVSVVNVIEAAREWSSACARWNCDNLILFPDRMGLEATLEIVYSEAVDWVSWAKTHGVIT